MNNPEEYENLIALLEKALEFYANKENYKNRPFGIELVSSVEMDEGSQARFALEQSKILIEVNRKLQEDYDKLMAAADQLQATDDMADPQKLMEVFKVFGNEDNIESGIHYSENEQQHLNKMKENLKKFEKNNEDNNIQ